MFKKIIALMLVAVISVSAGVAGTLAYLTDSDEKQNVFTTGDISIALNEKVGVVGTGATVTETEDGATYTGVMPGDKLVKEVTVENTGSNDAYIRVLVTLNNALEINKAIDYVYEKAGYSAAEVQAVYDYVFDGWGINYNPRPGFSGKSDARGVIDGTYGLPEHVLHVDFSKTTNGSSLIGATNLFIAGREKAGQYWVDGPGSYDGYYTKNMEDYEICYAYYLYLPAGESTTLFNGLKAPREFDKDQLAMFNGLTIDVVAEAIQADNIPGYNPTDVAAGLKNAMALLDGEDLNIVESADDLIENLENGEDVILGADVKIEPANMSNAYGKTGINVKNGQTIDGNGNTLDIKGAGGTWDSGICTSGGLIKNIKVTGSFRGIFIKKDANYNEKVVLENVILDGTTYTISVDSGTGKGLEARNSVFNGWTSYAATLGNVKFEKCSFGAGNGNNFSRPYAPTEYVNCEFAAGHMLDPRAAVTFENCTLNGVALTAENIGDLVKWNLDKVTVK